MAFDQNTFDDLESDIESLDETNSEDLDTSFDENELEEYGVWVKTGPEDVSPEEEEEIHLENMPASETMELTDEEDMLLGDLEENTEAGDFESMDDFSDLEDSSDEMLPEADEPAVSDESVEITDNFDDLESEEISFTDDDISETISDIAVEDFDELSDEVSQDTGEDLPSFETASTIEDDELEVEAETEETSEIEEVTLTDEIEESGDSIDEISEVSLDDFTDEGTSDVSLDDFMSSDSGEEHMPEEEDDEDEFLDLDLDLDDDQLFDEQEEEEEDDMDLDALIAGASDINEDESDDSSLDLDAIEDISEGEDEGEIEIDFSTPDTGDSLVEEISSDEELPDMEDFQADEESLEVSEEVSLDSFDTLEDEILENDDAEVELEIDSFDENEDLNISVDIEEDDIPLDSLDELAPETDEKSQLEPEDSIEVDFDADEIEDSIDLPEEEADIDLDISELGDEPTSIPGEDLLPDTIDVDMQESEEELPELNSNEYDFADISLDELTGGVQDVALSDLEQSDVIPEEDRIDNEDIEPFSDHDEEEAPASEEAKNKELSILEKIESELFSIKDELASLRSQLSTMKSAPQTADQIEEPNDESEFEGGFFDEDEDETIALTGDELDNILNNADITEEAGQPTAPEDDYMPELSNEIDLSDVLDGAPEADTEEQSEELQVFINGENAFDEVPTDESPSDEGPSDTSVETDENEVVFEDQIEDEIISEDDAFENIEDENIQDETENDIQIDDEYEPTAEEKAIIDEYNRELDNFAEEELILDEEDSFTEVEPNVIPEDQPQDEEEFLKDTQFEDSIGEEIEVAPKDEEPIDEISLKPVSDDNAQTPEPASEMPGQLKNEIKSVLSYMDQLLESLPEDKIQEFAQSEHFEVYKKLFEELGLGN